MADHQLRYEMGCQREDVRGFPSAVGRVGRQGDDGVSGERRFSARTMLHHSGVAKGRPVVLTPFALHQIRPFVRGATFSLRLGDIDRRRLSNRLNI
jgi:hypothetical protein